MERSKYLWYTDCHFNTLLPWALWKFVLHVNKEKPKGIFLTGDISDGSWQTIKSLEFLANKIDCPIYFVLGNHDRWFSSFEKTNQQIRQLCAKYSNLIWLTESDVIELDSEIALIGADGWYDALIGRSKYLKATLDWMLIDDFKQMSSMEERIKAFRKLAKDSCEIISTRLEKAIEQDYKTIYILTHVPPWKEATRDEGTLLESFWLPYNTNYQLGQVIENIMAPLKKKRAIVFSGHTHTESFIRVSRNIECQVGRANYHGAINAQKIYL